MRWSPSIVLTGAVATVTAGATTPSFPSTATISQSPSRPDIVVTARRNRASPSDPVRVFTDLCFDPNRLTGRSRSPADDSGWLPLDDKVRKRFGIVDSWADAYLFVDPTSGHVLVWQAERPVRKDNLRESRCTLIAVGGRAHTPLAREIAAVLHGTGTQRHVGRADGVAVNAGWSQWLWTAMPSRGSSHWQDVNGSSTNNRQTWLVVTDQRFYDDYDYVQIELKVRNTPGQAISLISLVYLTSADRDKSGVPAR